MRLSTYNETSREAAAYNQPRSQNQREEVAISLLTPGTRDELSERLGLPVQSVCGRINDLFRDYLVQPTGEYRKTRLGSKAEVMELNDMGIEWVEELFEE